jgi:hypothetical protein
MKTYTKEELIDWVMKQPDERPVYMGDGNNDGCGCVMTQFLRSKRIKFDFVYSYGYFQLGLKNKGMIDLGGRRIFEIFVYGNEPICRNFGDLKRFYQNGFNKN